jgi:hypothetical protein
MTQQFQGLNSMTEYLASQYADDTSLSINVFTQLHKSLPKPKKTRVFKRKDHSTVKRLLKIKKQQNSRNITIKVWIFIIAKLKSSLLSWSLVES